MIGRGLVSLAFVSAAFGAQECESLAKLTLAATTITRAESVAAGGNLPASCQVAGVIKPSSDSEIRFEVWMPSLG